MPQTGANVGEQVKEMILHHITNGWEVEVPSTHWSTAIQLKPDLWHFEIAGMDINLSISRHVLMMLVAAGLLILMALLLRRKISLVPKGFLSVIESIVLFIRDEIATPTLGHHYAHRLTPYLCTTFFFILTCNLLGLVPYGATATGNISVTAGLAFLSFIMIQFWGIKHMGLFGYLRHLVPKGVPLWLAPVMIVVELMGMLAKPFALCMRLFANMVAGHVVILSLIGLIFVLGLVISPVSVAFAVFMYLLELFVALLQAYIFTMLTSLFIGLMVATEH